MTINNLAQKFTIDSPKDLCEVINQNGEVLYRGRIEFLYNCDHELENVEVVSLGIGTTLESGIWVSEVISIEVNII